MQTLKLALAGFRMNYRPMALPEAKLEGMGRSQSCLTWLAGCARQQRDRQNQGHGGVHHTPGSDLQSTSGGRRPHVTGIRASSPIYLSHVGLPG
jgi:hypothetical protein